jgi:hypothetical protein
MHRHLEINLFAPGQSQAGERQRRRDRARGRRVEKLGVEGERAEMKADPDVSLPTDADLVLASARTLA